VAGEGPMFHPYFSAKPIRRLADLLTCDTARAGRFHQALQSLGVYKPFEKGYLSLAHGADELRVAERSFAQALRQS
jgi:glutamate-1-semialdehyde 2,1-aminomutase